LNPIDRAVALHERATDRLARGELARARRDALEALALFVRHDGASSPDAANVQVELGRIAAAADDGRAAERHFRRALAILPARARGDVAQVRANALLGLGNTLRIAGRYAEAAPVLAAAQRTARHAFPDARDQVGFLNARGVLYKFMGRYAAAERLYRRALEHTRDPAMLATLHHNLGGLCHARGRYAEGEPHARRSVVLRRRARGPAHVETAADEAALAALLEARGKLTEAERLYRHALAIFRRHYGALHYEVAVNLSNLAAVELRRGRLAVAERLYRESLAQLRRLLGAGHPDVAFTLNDLGATCQMSGRAADARLLYRQALAIFTRVLGPRHRETRTCRANLASCGGSAHSPAS
jgi:tetratricopeptide (TPR) repeat protein